MTFIWIASILMTIKSYDDENRALLDVRDNLLSSSQSSIISMYEKFSNFIYEAIIEKPEVLSIMYQSMSATDDERVALRKELENELGETYEVAVSYDFRQLHFHTFDGRSFYRFHTPELYGDSLVDVRETIRIVSTEKRYVTGFEEGRIFNGYRFVYPLFYDRQYVGSVEISISMKSLIDMLSRLYSSNDIGFILNRSVMENTVFSEEQSRYFISLVSEDYVSDREVFESLKNNPNGIRLFEDQSFLEKLRAVAKSYLRSGESFSATIEHDGQMIVAQYNALLTVSGNPIAYVFMIGESAQLYQLRNYRNTLIFVITLVYLILWFGIIYVNNRRNKITNMAMRDQLTQSYNRHSFFEFVAKELSRTSRTGMKMSFALMDVDHFKKVNDIHGHGVGDLVLKQIPMIVKRATRGEDVLARYGGEEFIIMMPNTDLEGAKVVAERIRQNMESYEFEYVHQVTISIGLAEKQPEESMDQCIERADKALYRAKENGRNRVEI